MGVSDQAVQQARERGDNRNDEEEQPNAEQDGFGGLGTVSAMAIPIGACISQSRGTVLDQSMPTQLRMIRSRGFIHADFPSRVGLLEVRSEFGYDLTIR